MNVKDGILVVLTVAIIAAASIGIVLLEDDGDDTQWDFPEPVKSEDRDYPAATAAREDFETAADACYTVLSNEESTLDDMASSVDSLAEGLLRIRDWNSWAMLDYYLDMEGMSETYVDWSALALDAQDVYFTTIKATLKGPCGEKVADMLNTIGVGTESFLNYNEMDEREKGLRAQVETLCTQYDGLMNKGPLDRTTFISAAELYIQTVNLNTEIARINNYDSYSAYMYEQYGRDYTPEDTKVFESILSPVLSARIALSDLADGTSAFARSNLSWMEGLDSNGIMDAVADYTDTIADRYSDLMDFMQDNRLIFLNESKSEINGQAYTSNLYMSGSAYIFADGYSGYNETLTFAHEFGHASAMCLNRNLTSCIDVNEIHSTGMEVLFASSGASSLNGCGAALSIAVLTDLMNNILLGTSITGLELYAYDTVAGSETLTVEDLEKRFDELLSESGLSFGTGCDGLAWTMVNHVFNSPLYYVSYITSSIDAIDLFSECIKDHASAEAIYIRLVGQRNVEGYRAAVKEAGLVDAFDRIAVADTIVDAMSALKSFV